MKIMTSIAIIWLTAMTAAAQTTTISSGKDEAEVRAVIETFRTAIITKDKEHFLQLFHGESIPWLAVYDDASLARLRRREPDMAKADSMGTPGPRPFIAGIAASAKTIEEKFWNIRIDTDGLVASVHFDYSFHVGDYKSNWGQEAWQLVRTDQGWKINSVIYSVHLNPEPPTQILFVCEHGNVKSLMAASYFNQMAQQQNLPFRAASYGIKVDTKPVPAAIVDGLRADGFDVAAFQPLEITALGVSSAKRVITIGVSLPDSMRAAAISPEKWDDVPPATINFEASSKSLKAHVEKLIQELRTPAAK